MLIGIDFDNTIVCYDRLLHAIAVETGLIPVDLPCHKEQIRDYLRDCRAEESWTELQGRVYGVEIERAPPFSGVLEFFNRCRQRQIEVCIISHRTRRPYRGPDVDLHAAARHWLNKHQFQQSGMAGLSTERVYFEETKQQKLDRIEQVACTHFIDDLLEFLTDPGFPSEVHRILFDPHGRHRVGCQVTRVESWPEIQTLIESD